jgi:hypothetical protein
MKKLIYKNNNMIVGKYKRKLLRTYSAKEYYEAYGWICGEIYQDEDVYDEEFEFEIIMYKKE